MINKVLERDEFSPSKLTRTESKKYILGKLVEFEARTS